MSRDAALVIVCGWWFFLWGQAQSRVRTREDSLGPSQPSSTPSSVVSSESEWVGDVQVSV